MSLIRDTRKPRTLTPLLTLSLVASAAFGQDAVYSPTKPSLPSIHGQILLVDESVVNGQWVNTLSLVNIPSRIATANPGQCIRVAVLANGDNRDEYLRQTKVSFRVSFAGRMETLDAAPLAHFKRIKPEGGDFVAGALAAGGIKVPDALQSMASLGATPTRWCVPSDAGDAEAKVEASIEPPGASRLSATATIRVEAFSTGRKKSFGGAEEFGRFMQTYYQQPNPARLLPAIEFMVAQQMKQPRPGHTEIVGAFVSAALKAQPAGARDLLSRIQGESGLVRAFGLLALRSAGYDIGPILEKLPQEESAKFASLPALDDPYNRTPDQALFHRLDMLWAVFGATGQFEPVKAVADALAWRPDYEAFAEMRKNRQQPSSITPSIVRGVVYTAAGWSLNSLMLNDGLVADYIDYLIASEATTQSVRSELKGLSSNPAFQRAGGK